MTYRNSLQGHAIMLDFRFIKTLQCKILNQHHQGLISIAIRPSLPPIEGRTKERRSLK